MAEQKKLRPVGNITQVAGQYQKDGETKNRYITVGTLFQRLDEETGQPTNRMAAKFDALPLPNEKGEVWLNIYPIQRKDASTDGSSQDNGPDDQPIDLSEIPF